jgi:protein-disulfide isomerase
MSKGSAIVMILLTLIGGVALGNLIGRQGGGEDDAADVAEAGSAEDAAEVERFKVPVSKEQPSYGPEDALVTIVEFSDFQCPFCSRVNPTMKKIKEEYGKKVRIVWRNNPLPFHENAGPAAETALEAFAQGGSDKFWKMHDLLFQNQQALSRADLEKYGAQLGLSVDKLKQALDSGTHKRSIAADQALAAKIDARGTPGFFINGRKLMGAQPYEEFKKVIDEEVTRAEALVKKGTAKSAVYAALMKDAKESAPPPAPPPSAAEPDNKAVYKVPVGDSPQKGPSDALVTIVQFSDFECPFCSRVEPTINEIMKKYGKDVRVVWKNNPLPFHQNAMPAAEATMEAYAQGGAAKFWKMHELLFAHQRELSREKLDGYAKEVGLNAAKFAKALDSHVHKSKVEADQKLAQSLGASGTPSFFINGRNLRGAQPLPNFVTLIDEELAKAQALVKAGTPRAKVYETVTKDGATAPAAAPAARGQEQEPDADKLYDLAVPAKAPRKGGKNAKVVIQTFSDFQCPFCGRVLPTMQQIEKAYGDKVQVVWRNYPLPFHPNAMPAAEAAMEVYAQAGDKKFWAYHDLLFQNQQALSRADLEKYASQVGGIDMARFKKALDENTHKASVQADMDAVQKAGAQIGTPSFFINGRLIQGAQPFDAFKAAIDKALGKS